MDDVVRFFFKYRTAIFSKSQFGFGARPSIIVIIALVLIAALFVYFVYVRPSLKMALGWRIALMALRCALVVVIAFCLMRPVIVVPAIAPQSSYVVVLMDDSSSMLLPDESAGSRLDTLKRLMTIGSQFETQLAEKFKVRAYKFASAAERVGDASELRGEGERTDLAGVIQQVTRESSGLPLAGIVLLSDGSHNGAAEEDFNNVMGTLRARNLPLFTIGVGQTSLDGDIELVRATAPRRMLAGSPVTAELLVRASGGSQRSVKIDLKEDNHPLLSRQVPVPGEATTVARITFTPSSPGLHRYVLTAEPSAEEQVADNNSQEFVIEVEDSNPKILYIEGEPRWEYGKLRGALADEKNVVLVSVLRSADGKFYRQGVESGEELTAGFPSSEEEVFKYDAIIIGSLEATFFTFDQLRAIEQFVSRRGGAMMMIGGAKAFNAGGYGETPMADLLPVFLKGEAAAGSETQAFKAAPSERGRDNPAARLSDQAEANQKAWEQMPAITLLEVITETKPGATVILEARSAKEQGRTVPLLVEQRYGRGRSLAMLASDTWRWRMMLESKNKSYETFWRNLLRYLVESTRHKVEATTERSYYALQEPVRIRVEVADEKFLNVKDAIVTARIATPTGRSIDLPLKPVTESGFEGYAGSLLPDEDGLYRVEVSARSGKTSASLGSAQTSFAAGPLNREARDAAQNRQLLERIAAETGGSYYTADRVNNLVEDLTHSEGAGAARVTYDLWDMPINFMLVVMIAAAEWFIRKRKGLA